MRRLATLAILPCSVVLFVAFAATAGADDTIPITTTPEVPPPIDEPTIPFPEAGRAPGKLIQPGVTIGGLLVGGFTKAEARSLVTERAQCVTLVATSPARRVGASNAVPSRRARKASPTSRAVRTRGGGAGTSRRRALSR